MFADIKQYIKDLLLKIKSKGLSKKLVIISTLCFLAILIPSMVAIWNVYLKKDAEAVESTNITVSFWDITDDELLAEDTINEKNVSDSPVVNLFYNIKSKSSLSAPPENAPKDPNFKLSITHGTSYVQYDCYFSESLEESYLMSDTGIVYAVNATQYEKFLSSNYSNRVYVSATPPVLTTDNGATVLPSEVEWYFKKSTGAFVESNAYDTVSTDESYQMSGKIALNFSSQPDSCEIIVYEISEDNLTKTEVYRGDQSRLAYITAQSGRHLLFDVTVEWYESSEVDCYGKLYYSFIIDCKDYATFELSSQSVHPGEFVKIVLHDVTNPDSVIYSVDTDVDKKNNVLGKAAAISTRYFSTKDAVTFLKEFIPQFIESDNILTALIPIPYGTPSGTFNFTIASGVTKKSFAVEIASGETVNTVNLDKSAVQLSKTISDSAIKEVTAVLDSVSKQCRQSTLYRGEFLSPDSSLYSPVYSYGDILVPHGAEQSPLSALGNLFANSLLQDRSVSSANSGIVAFVGYKQHIGHFVVIDHGMGLCTWYCNLSDTDVLVGDVIAKGELVGKIGESTLTSSRGVLILCSIYDAFINPDIILGKKIP